MIKRKHRVKKTNYAKVCVYFFIGLSVFIISFILQAKIVFTILSHASNLVSKNYTSVKFQNNSGGCPTTSSQTYGTLTLRGHEIEGNNPDGATNSDMNITLRGYQEVNQAHQLVDYGGDTDPNMPPVLGTFFTHIPSIVKTYQVHQWDYTAGKPKPELETAWPVNVIGLYTTPGEPLVGLKAGREIGGGYILTVVYAAPTTITFSYSDDESGYPIYLDNLCVDPNLLALYNKQNAAGRHDMPAIRTGEVFGYGNGSDVRIAIRDTGSWMDPRSRKDWWQGFSGDLPPAPLGNNIQPTLPPGQPTQPPGQPTQPVVQPTQPISQTPSNIPAPQVVATNPPLYLTPTVIVSQPVVSNPVNQQPTQPINHVLPTPSITSVPPTPTPEKPLSQKIVESPVIRFIQSLPGLAVIFIHTILP